MPADAHETVRATYLIETPHPVERAAEILAGEQSSGTFTQVPGETEELKQTFRARVQCIEPLDSTDTLVDLAARSQKVRPMGEQPGCPAGRWQKVASALEARFRVRAHFLQICSGSVLE